MLQFCSPTFKKNSFAGITWLSSLFVEEIKEIMLIALCLCIISCQYFLLLMLYKGNEIFYVNAKWGDFNYFLFCTDKFHYIYIITSYLVGINSNCLTQSTNKKNLDWKAIKKQYWSKSGISEKLVHKET